MKNYTPGIRERILGLVLQFDSERQDRGKSKYFTTGQRILINQERGAIMAGLDYCQSESVESQIECVTKEITSTRWHPETPIQYI